MVYKNCNDIDCESNNIDEGVDDIDGDGHSVGSVVSDTMVDRGNSDENKEMEFYYTLVKFEASQECSQRRAVTFPMS